MKPDRRAPRGGGQKPPCVRKKRHEIRAMGRSDLPSHGPFFDKGVRNSGVSGSFHPEGLLYQYVHSSRQEIKDNKIRISCQRG